MHVLEVKNLGAVTKFLGIGVTYDYENRYALEQEQCILELLATTGLAISNLARTPIRETKRVNVKAIFDLEEAV